MLPEDAKARIQNCRAQMHTDSLTVLIDLSKVSAAVAEAFRQVLKIPDHPEGGALVSQEISAFQSAVWAAAERLSDTDELDVLEFATLLSAFFHECRHVHDLRATRIGAELLLQDMQVYCGASLLVKELRRWQEGRPDRRLPLPLPARLDFLGSEKADIADRFTKARAERDLVAARWEATSNGFVLPGHSIRALFETLGFSVQVEWLYQTFGAEIAGLVFEGTIGDGDVLNTQYYRPLQTLLSLAQSKNLSLDPEQHDLPQIIVYALNLSGLDSAFEDRTSTSLHPGVWFDRISKAYIDVYARENIPAIQKSAAAISMAAHRMGIGSLTEIFNEANCSISALQETYLRDIAQFVTKQATGDFEGFETMLLATEVAIDYRDMARLFQRSADYHHALGYVSLLLGGELTTLHVRVKVHDGYIGDFRLPSETPSNQVGGNRVASAAAQQMRFFLNGRNLADHNFFSDDVFKQLRAPAADGPGLLFDVIQ
jgi:hypothetical protein